MFKPIYLPKTNDSLRSLQDSSSRLILPPSILNRFLNSKLTMQYVLIMSIIFLCLIVRPVQAQSTLDQQKMAAVMSIITMYLFGEREPPIDPPTGTEIAIDIGATYQIPPGETSYVQFDLQTSGIEFCLDVAASSAVSSSNIVVEVNGTRVAASLGKDNCYRLSRGQQREINYIVIRNNSGVTLTLTRLELAPTFQTSSNGLQKVTRGDWDERAVRKVLKIFAFGGHATDAQIQTWADMDASNAIQEMLNFDEHNLKLSPLAQGENYTQTASSYGTLTEFLEFISDTSSNIPIPAGNRGQYGLDGYNFDDGFARMATVRGLNPFRQRIGFWETNYHLAVNRDANVSRRQMAKYYDDIMGAHEDGLPYKDVMGVAAKSAAAAMQYGHRNNEWNDATQECECNDDFAREIHQLYYGIFGDGDPNHEDVTIPETAKMLTGMPVPYINNFGFSLEVDYQDGVNDGEHHLAPVDIFQTLYGPNLVSGADAAAKIDNLMPISMQHPESLENLPIMIISVLADDNLSEGRKNQLRAAWASMGVNRNFLDFIHTYAISSMFHANTQFKYLTSHERAFYIANKNNLDNLEAYFSGSYFGDRAGREIDDIIDDDFAGEIFKPLHNVFGGQTSSEASDSSLVFENNYNRLTDREQELRDAVVCDSCDQGQSWEKKWQTVLPQRANGNYYVSDVAEWLWMHAVGSLDNFTELERAHLYSLLGAARDNPGNTSDGDHAFDFNLVMCVVADHAYDPEDISPTATITDILATNRWDDFCLQNDNGSSGFLAHELAELNAQYTGDEIANSVQMQEILTLLGNETLQLNASGSQHSNSGADLRKNARERVSTALGFIFTTPFIFAEGQ